MNDEATESAAGQTIAPTDTPSTDAAEPAAVERTDERAGRSAAMRRRIGSQRPGAAKIKAQPKPPVMAEKRSEKRTPIPNTREQLAPEDELELAAALGDMPLADMLEPAEANVAKELEPESRQHATVLAIHGDNVFVDLGGPHQGVMSLRQFGENPPAIGARMPVIVQRFDADEGLYAVGLSGAAAVVEDWSQISEGLIVEARVTGHNKGGLECEVSQLRGFIPASQIAAYRVENFEEFVGQRLACVVVEVDPERRKLVLSHRAVVEREKAAAREQLMTQLAEGQIREGTVRSIQDFGAFVDLGG
ncbi:MAG TPA: S1 RNA-binding domain-containing protein, partial [Pirellulales bacterium]|nr:S1 RNA-binding domain-containing protein [Pirellulales bacterium]